jgi:hypothetical protein
MWPYPETGFAKQQAALKGVIVDAVPGMLHSQLFEASSNPIFAKRN